MELHECGLPPRVHQPERVYAEALHHPVTARQGTVGHQPHHVVHRLRLQTHEVPERVVRGSRLRHLVVRLRLERVDQVRKLDAVLDEEHRHVVADQVEVSLVGVELGGEATYVARRVDGAPGTLHSGEPHEHRGTPGRLGQERRPGILRHRLVYLEVAVGGRSPRVHDPLGDSFVVEPHDLLAQVEVLDQAWTSYPSFERVVGVLDQDCLIGGEPVALGVDLHRGELGRASPSAFGRPAQLPSRRTSRPSQPPSSWSSPPWSRLPPVAPVRPKSLTAQRSPVAAPTVPVWPL